MFKPLMWEAVAAGILLGMWAAIFYTIDQWQDIETDFARRVKNYAYLIARANMRISLFYYFAVTAIVTMHVGSVLMGWLPVSTLKVMLLLPLYHFTGVLLDYQFERGILMMLLGMLLCMCDLLLGTKRPSAHSQVGEVKAGSGFQPDNG